MAPRLQEGIYHAPGVRPGPAYGITFLQAAADVPADRISNSIRGLWELYQALKQGNVHDLPGQLVPGGNLTCMVCYGIKAFELTGARRTVPAELQQFGRFRSPLTAGGGPLLLGSGQLYADDVRKNPATETLAVQFIADTQLAVNRAIVETWKFLQDRAASSQGEVLSLAGFFQGFQRDDHRSWLDFHDGTSNLPSERREEVIVIKDASAGADQWTVGGTYMVYIRMAVDLSAWRRLTKAQQDFQIGREKLTGCPLVPQDSGSAPAGGCPVTGTIGVHEPGNDEFFEPEDVPRPSPLGMSHVQRVNHHRQDLDARDSLRIFRQGYEFLEQTDAAPGFRAGLNFVSFQDTPERMFRIFTQEGWLGRTNFGGDPNQPLPGMDRLLTTRAAGVFFVPPVIPTEVFPGSSIFMP
jgi:Dyp-type peroxidase family